MAEIPMNGLGETRNSRQSAGAVANYAGAVVSLALIIGVATWGYKLLARDVSGVPVVRAAADEPMRIVPENPGGAEAEHQGLAINSVMADGEAQKPANKLVLAPNPVVLTEEDIPLGQDTVGDSAPRVEIAVAPTVPAFDADEGEEPLSPQMASIKAFADQLANGVVPLNDADAPENKLPAETAMIKPLAPVVLEAAEPAPIVQASAKSTLRPKMRPTALKTSFTPASTPEPAQTAGTEVDAAGIAAGTRLVQLGAFDSPEVAREEWSRLNARFEDYLSGKQRVVMRAKSGGRVFYRLRALGFADLSDARRFCAALVAEKADCIPVVSK